MSEKHYDAFEQANVRVDHLIYIPAAVAAGSIPDALKEALEDDLFGGGNEQVLTKLPCLAGLLDGDGEGYSDDYALESLGNCLGFLAQLATPVPTKFYSETSFGFSWGYYRKKWVHADDMDDLSDLAKEFSADVVSLARSKAAA